MQRCIEAVIIALLLTPIGFFAPDLNSLFAGPEAGESRLAFFSSVPLSIAPASGPGSEARKPAQAAPVEKATRKTSSSAAETSKSQVRFAQRVDHANELLGRHYNTSIVRTTESVKQIETILTEWTRDALPKAYKARHKKIAKTIINEAHRYGFDPIFLMAVITSESAFNPKARGGAGEIGLMQILPSTGEWIAKQSGRVKWRGDKTLEDPRRNIELGAWYLSWLRDKFDSHARLYLAAYNMGQKNVNRALDRKIWPKDYPIHVMKNYVAYYSDLKARLEAEKKKKSGTLARNEY